MFLQLQPLKLLLAILEISDILNQSLTYIISKFEFKYCICIIIKYFKLIFKNKSNIRIGELKEFKRNDNVMKHNLQYPRIIQNNMYIFPISSAQFLNHTQMLISSSTNLNLSSLVISSCLSLRCSILVGKTDNAAYLVSHVKINLPRCFYGNQLLMEYLAIPPHGTYIK